LTSILGQLLLIQRMIDTQKVLTQTGHFHFAMAERSVEAAQFQLSVTDFPHDSTMLHVTSVANFHEQLHIGGGPELEV
jgi:hypothetical protein